MQRPTKILGVCRRRQTRTASTTFKFENCRRRPFVTQGYQGYLDSAYSSKGWQSISTHIAWKCQWTPLDWQGKRRFQTMSHGMCILRQSLYTSRLVGLLTIDHSQWLNGNVARQTQLDSESDERPNCGAAVVLLLSGRPDAAFGTWQCLSFGFLCRKPFLALSYEPWAVQGLDSLAVVF